MAIDPERHERIRAALAKSALDALVCCAPTEVLLLTGYWPVIGASVVVFSRCPATYTALFRKTRLELAKPIPRPRSFPTGLPRWTGFHSYSCTSRSVVVDFEIR